MIKKILIITLFYFLNIGQITIANESDSRSVLKDIKTRGSGGKIINIQPRKDINIFKDLVTIAFQKKWNFSLY